MSGADWISLAEWVVAFRALHESARNGKLAPPEMDRYEEEREALAKALLVAQRLSVKPGHTARQTLRVVRALPVEIVRGAQRAQSTTLDLGLGGFAVLLTKPPRVQELVEFSLTLQSASTAVNGRARVVNLQRKGRPYRVAFTFEGLSPADARRVEFEVFDAALANIPPR